MGVVHKLKDNVIEFILEQKKNNPSLSCRHLANLTGGTFKIDIAKSSINKIIKKAELSSTVGRRPLSCPLKKFQIPDAKKKELLENLESLETKTTKATPIPASQRGSQKLPIESTVYEGMGAILLKIAHWQLAGHSFGQFIKRNMPGVEAFLGQQPIAEFEDLCGTMSLLKILDIDIKTHRGQTHPLWVLSRDSGQSQLQKLEELMRSAQIPFHLSVEYLNTKEQIFHEAKGVKIFLEDGNCFIFDVSLEALVAAEEDLAFSWPVNKAIEFLSSRLISQRDSIVLKKIPTEPELFKKFCELMECFEGLPGKNIKSIQLLGRRGKALTDFSTIPLRKRTFMAGLWPAQKEFEELTRSIQWPPKTPYYDERADKTFYFSESTIDLCGQEKKIKALKIAAIWEEENGGPILAVVTNKNILAREIIAEYWPRGLNEKDDGPNVSQYFADGCEQSEFPEASPLSSLRTWEDIFYDFGNSLHSYCQRNFFPRGYQSLNPKTVMDRLYGLAGYFSETKNVLSVTLLIPDDYPHRKDAQYAVKAVNQHCVEDEKGVRIRMALEEKQGRKIIL